MFCRPAWAVGLGSYSGGQPVAGASQREVFAVQMCNPVGGGEGKGGTFFRFVVTNEGFPASHARSLSRTLGCRLLVLSYC